MSYARAEAAENEQEALVAAYQEIFDRHPAGRIVLFDLMRECGMLATSFVPGQPDTTAYQEGQRVVVLYVLQKLRYGDSQLAQLARKQVADPFTVVDPGEHDDFDMQMTGEEPDA